MQCVRCHKKIEDNSHFIRVEEVEKTHINRVNFFHFNCWEEMMDSKQKLGQAMGVLGGLTGFMKKEGILHDTYQLK